MAASTSNTLSKSQIYHFSESRGELFGSTLEKSAFSLRGPKTPAVSRSLLSDRNSNYRTVGIIVIVTGGVIFVVSLMVCFYCLFKKDENVRLETDIVDVKSEEKEGKDLSSETANMHEDDNVIKELQVFFPSNLQANKSVRSDEEGDSGDTRMPTVQENSDVIQNKILLLPLQQQTMTIIWPDGEHVTEEGGKFDDSLFTTVSTLVQEYSDPRVYFECDESAVISSKASSTTTGDSDGSYSVSQKSTITLEDLDNFDNELRQSEC